MAELAKQYVSRAYRYSLLTEDNQLMFFVEGENGCQKEPAQLQNVSSTGLAFTISQYGCPAIGCDIKFEFNVPNESQIAWWGRVVRVKPFSPFSLWQSNQTNLPTDLQADNLVLVAIEFDHMPLGHQNTIRSGIKKRLKQFKKAQNISRTSYLYYLVKNSMAKYMKK